MIIRSPYPPVEIPASTFDRYVLDACVEFGDRPALVDGPTGRILTFTQVVDGAERVAAALAARGLAPGDVVGIVLPNMPEFALAFFGTLRAGGVVTTVNPLSTAEEMVAQLGDAGISYLVTVAPLLPTAGAAAGPAGARETFLVGDVPDGAAATPFDALLTAGGPAPAGLRSPDDTAVLPYSSGTSGLPKGVVLTHRQLVAAAVQLPPIAALESDSAHVAVLPFFHIYGMVYLLAAHLCAGATTVVMPRFELAEFLELIQRYHATHLLVVPPIVVALAKHPLVDSYDLSSLRWIGCGAAPLGEDVALGCSQRLGVPVCQGFGMTETAAVTSLVPSDRRDDLPRGGSGVLAPNVEARFVDVATGKDVEVGEPGELLVRGPNIMSGYLNQPSATADCLDADGWLHTGDLGHVDKDGVLFITDRVKELIKYKAFQVAPARLESLLHTHPAVADVAVVGRSDEEAGEVPVAYVVPRGELDPAELMSWVAGRVAPYEKIRGVEIVEAIPRTASGKVLRRRLSTPSP